jgi:hypothetical protein
MDGVAMSQVQKIDNYTPAQIVERRRLIALIEKEKRYYLTAVQPYLDALVKIEFDHDAKYILISDK